MAVNLSPDDESSGLQDEDAQVAGSLDSPPTNRSQFLPPQDLYFSLTSPDPTPIFTDLNWIDENQRRDNHEGLKREVRSHIRRGIHTRQRRLNVAARPRHLNSGARRIVQKDRQKTAQISISSPQGAILPVKNSIGPQLVRYTTSNPAAPEPLTTPYGLSNQGTASASSSTLFPRFPALEPVSLAGTHSQSGQQHNFGLVPHQKFNNSEFAPPQLQ
jgi:hypothetical protein